MDEIHKKLGSLLKEERLRQNKTQKEIEGMIGLPAERIGKIENAYYKARADTYELYAKALGMTLTLEKITTNECRERINENTSVCND